MEEAYSFQFAVKITCQGDKEVKVESEKNRV